MKVYRKVWVTGAAGFIGRHLAHELSVAGNKVIGLGHGHLSPMQLGECGFAHWLSGDLCFKSLRSMCSSVGLPDVIFHLAGGSSVAAAISNPLDDFFRTVSGTAELLEWMRVDSPQTKLVTVSSAAVYGSGHEGGILEDAPLTPFSPYGHHKRMMEDLCHSYAASYGLNVSIARLFSVYGRELKKQLLWDLCTRFKKDRQPVVLGGTGDELRDWTDVRDVVRVLTLLSKQHSAEVVVVNVGTGLGTSVRQIATAIAHHCSMSDAESAFQFSGQARLGDPFSLVANVTRLNSLGYVCEKPVFEGLADYVRWFLCQSESSQ